MIVNIANHCLLTCTLFDHTHLVLLDDLDLFNHSSPGLASLRMLTYLWLFYSAGLSLWDHVFLHAHVHLVFGLMLLFGLRFDVIYACSNVLHTGVVPMYASIGERRRSSIGRSFGFEFMHVCMQ